MGVRVVAAASGAVAMGTVLPLILPTFWGEAELTLPRVLSHSFAAVVTAGILTAFTLAQRQRRGVVWWRLLLVQAIIQVANLVEAIAFGIIPVAEGTRLLMVGLVASAATAAAVSALAPARRKRDLSPGNRAAGSNRTRWMRLVPAGATGYTVLYLLAGMLAFPFVRDFYPPEDIPPIAGLAALQFFVRGPMLLMIPVLVATAIPSGRRVTALFSAAMLAGIGGLAALLSAGDVLPWNIRVIHLVEVCATNALFGYIFGRSAARLVSLPAPGPCPT